MRSALRNAVLSSSMWRTEGGLRVSVRGVSSVPTSGSGQTQKPLSDSDVIIKKKGAEEAVVTTTTGSISKAMKSYLERAEEHQVFMKEQENDFVFGRRHLANMMGKDPETFSQKDIDEAIRYLFPAGLFEPKARPIMRPPNEIFPKQKAAQFDATGRPHHPFFYTTKPNFFFLIHEMMGKINALNSSRDYINTVDATTGTTVATTKSGLEGTIWITKDEFEARLLEHVTDSQYEEWINCMERIASHPKLGKNVEFLKSYRKPLTTQNIQQAFPPVLLEADGKQSVKVLDCQKKKSEGTVIVRMPGTGKFNINGKELDWFDSIRARETVIYPLQLVGWLGTVDVEATCTAPFNRSEMAKAALVRWGIAVGIAALGADVEALRLAGLLTRDWRRKERSHVGFDGARDRWTWKKR